jgi:hypothetical protein
MEKCSSLSPFDGGTSLFNTALRAYAIRGIHGQVSRRAAHAIWEIAVAVEWFWTGKREIQNQRIRQANVKSAGTCRSLPVHCWLGVRMA